MKTYLILLLNILMISAYGQSKKQIESYLRNSWNSAAITYETGDTIQDLSQRLVLRRKGKMNAKMDGIDRTGTWKYLEESKSLELIIVEDDNSEKVVFEIRNNVNQVLSLVQKSGDRSRTVIFVEEGSGIVFETSKAPEMSFEEILAESDSNQNADLGYTPAGNVIERVDYNFELEVEANGDAGSSKGDGIVYLLESTDGSQKVVVIRGQNAMPEEWYVLNKTDEYGVIYYQCNLKYTYKRGEKIEVNTKAKVRIADPNVIFKFDNGKTIKFTIVEN
ncbi:MAG: hypothetical protein ABFS32_20960 [Bacteroidota bacterium]